MNRCAHPFLFSFTNLITHLDAVRPLDNVTIICLLTCPKQLESAHLQPPLPLNSFSHQTPNPSIRQQYAHALAQTYTRSLQF